MQSKPFEFRFRFFIHLAIFLIGFDAPWNYWRAVDTKPNTWAWLGSFAFAHGMTFQAASILFLALGIFFALITALLRTWSSAYMNASIVKDAAMHGGRIVAAGPYRYMRNPLYLSVFVHTFALALLMPPSGAIFTLIAVAIFEMRLTMLEERFLGGSADPVYLEYKTAVPRILPNFSAKAPHSNAKPEWASAFVGEIYFWGVFFTFAVLGWRYNAQLLTRGVLVSLGASMIVRALLPKAAPDSAPAQIA